MYKKGGFPDLTGDGKITRADILKGRGVFKSGGMKDPNPGITALRKEAPEVVAKMGYGMGGMKDMYQAGGLLNASKQDQIAQANQLYKQQQLLTPKSRFQSGGMYEENQIPAGLGSTAMSMYQESDPRLQEQREASLAKEQAQLTAGASQMKQEIEADKLGDEQKIAGAQAEATSGMDKGMGVAGQLVNFGAQAGIGQGAQEGIEQGKNAALGAGSGLGNQALAWNPATGRAVGTQLGGSGTSLGGAFKGAAEAYKAQRATNMAIKAGAPMSSAMSSGQAGAQALGTGLQSFATSGAGLGTIAALAGKGISKLSDDGDATKSNVGEYSGSILGSAGSGAAMGSMLGPVGTLVGGIGGALYGAGKQFFGTKAAKKEKQKLERDRQVKIDNFSNELTKDVAMQRGQVRAGNLKQKTYSGYDLGRNVIAQMGGMRMGTPRYGY